MNKRQPQNLDQVQLNAILENSVLTQADFDAINATITNSKVYIDGGKVKQLTVFRKIKQLIASIDWLNVTMKDSTFTVIEYERFGKEDDGRNAQDVVIEASKKIDQIFGFGITVAKPSGAFFYDRSYELGNKYGLVCHGGQADTLLISINGTGLSQALEGWENRLFVFLKSADFPTITRIDLAHDDFNPDFFTLDNCLLEYKKGAFKNGKRSPSVSQAGNWIEPDGRGRTFYIGRRTNGLYLRIYEKGLQLGSESTPNWVRCEVELKSVDRIIPLDVLLRPHHYFAGSFPIFNRLSQEQERILTYQHEVKSDLEHRTKWGKRQSGAFINLLSQLGYTDEEIVQMLKAKTLPKAFKQKFLENDLENLHELPRQVPASSNNLTH